MISGKWFPLYDLRNVVVALGSSRCDEALDLLRDLPSDDTQAKQLGDAWIKAVAAIETTESKQLLLSLVDPYITGLPNPVDFGRDDVLTARIVELARRDHSVERSLTQLCVRELPSSKRLLLAKIIASLGTPTAVAGLHLIDDNAEPPIPFEIGRLVESAFVEHRPYGRNTNTYTLAPRSSNAIRVKLIEMAASDDRRRKSALSLLAQIEKWRLDYGRPSGEPRHPALGSVDQWPPG